MPLQLQVGVSSSAMFLMSVFALLISVVAFIPLISTSNDTNTLVDIYWASSPDLGNGKDIYAYISAYKFIIKSHGSIYAFGWNSAECTVLESMYLSSFCNECERGFEHFIAYVSVLFVFSTFSIAFSAMRYYNTKYFIDSRLQGAIICSSLVTILFGIATVITFDITCLQNWPGDKNRYTLGPAIVCIIVVLICKFLEIILHGIMFVDEKRNATVDVGLDGVGLN